jgi:hypothetical protein
LAGVKAAPAVEAAAPAPVRASGLHTADPTTPAQTAQRAPQKLLPGQIDRAQAELEGRAKIFWGDPPDEVLKFLMRNNISQAEAAELVAGWFSERAAALRSSGIGKIVTGTGMACVPVAGWFIFNSSGFIPMKLFAILIMIGLWGAWRALRGTLMVVSPRSEKGDVADT